MAEHGGGSGDVDGQDPAADPFFLTSSFFKKPLFTIICGALFAAPNLRSCFSSSYAFCIDPFLATIFQLTLSFSHRFPSLCYLSSSL